MQAEYRTHRHWRDKVIEFIVCTNSYCRAYWETDDLTPVSLYFRLTNNMVLHLSTVLLYSVCTVCTVRRVPVRYKYGMMEMNSKQVNFWNGGGYGNGENNSVTPQFVRWNESKTERSQNQSDSEETKSQTLTNLGYSQSQKLTNLVYSHHSY